MTINTDDKQIMEIITLLEKLSIPAQDCALAERYLKGEVGDEVLDRFQRIDFAAAAVPNPLVQELNAIDWRLGQNGMRDLWRRLVNVLFAIGHDTSSVLFSNCGVGCGQRYKEVVIWIKKCAAETGYLRAYDMTRFTMDDLLRDIDNKPENLGRFIDQLKGEGAKYYLTVLAVYFGTKYPETEALQTVNQECGKGLLEAADIPFMQVYEEGLLGCLDEWLSNQGCAAHGEIVTAIRMHQLTPQLFAGTKQCSYTIPDRKKLCLIVTLAYVNYMFSDVLRDIVRTCLSVDAEQMLFAMSDVLNKSPDSKGKLCRRGGDCGALFWIELETYIRWLAFDAAKERNTYYKAYVNAVQIPFLKNRLKEDQESYLNAIDQDSYTALLAKKGYPLDEAVYPLNLLKDILKAENPKLYEQAAAGKPDYDRIIGYLVRNTSHAEQAREYLRGHCSISELYPYEAEFAVDRRSVEYVKARKAHWDDEAFLNRCKAFMVLSGSGETTIVEKKVLKEYMKQLDPKWKYEKYAAEENKLRAKCVEQFFQILDGEHLDIAHQLKGFVASYTAYNGPCGCEAETFMLGAANAFAKYLDSGRRAETIEAFSGTVAEGRYMALLAMRKDTAKNRKEILRFASETTKLVKNELLDILYGQQDWEEDIKTLLLEGKKAAQRETAVQVLAHWQQEGSKNYNEVLLQAIEKEKNAKVLSLLQGTLNIQESERPQAAVSKEELVKQMHKGNRKKSLAWAYEKPFSAVHTTDGNVADEVYMQALLLCYASQEKNGVSNNAQILAAALVTEELAIYMNELFDKWLAAGAESKKRWVLYAAAIHGGEDIVQRLYHQIQEWPQQARGAIAAEAVRALALSPSPRALLLVDGIARKFKFKQVKAAAGEALAFAAAELGITREELSDRIVPTLGFDENMQRTFDYGERVFKVVLTLALDIEVYDENGKKLKNLPAPGKKDDAEKAAAACEAFKQMKKQLKTTVSSQKARLEYALSVRREWTADAWKALFVRNPLMHQFAIGLVWGVYEDSQLIQSFRYMEDGSFNTQDEEEYELPEGARISLVHPLELSGEEKAAWKEQFKDYEITQPIEQLDREIYVMTDGEAGKKSFERFGGYIVNDLSLNGKLTGLGWYRGSVQDAGGFYTYYREDAETGLGVELHFSGTYVGGLNDDVTIYDARFYQAGAVEHGSYVYDEADKEKAYLLKDIPPRYFSEIALQLARATASSVAREEDWKAKVRTLD